MLARHFARLLPEIVQKSLEIPQNCAGTVSIYRHLPQHLFVLRKKLNGTRHKSKHFNLPPKIEHYNELRKERISFSARENKSKPGAKRLNTVHILFQTRLVFFPHD